MNIQEKTIKVDIDNPKQLYDLRLFECRAFMQNAGGDKIKVFQWYCNFYEINEANADKLEPRFRNFWKGATRDFVMLEKYEHLIDTIKKS